MKPKTRFQYKVAAANERLQPIKDKAVEWAFHHTLNHYAFRSPKGLTTCLDCGHKWHEKGDKKCICPKCSAKLEINDTLCRKAVDKSYCSVLETQDGMQIQRVFLLTAVYRKGGKPEIHIRETLRYWLDENGQSAVTALRRTLGFYRDSFSLCSDIELRNDSDVFQYIADCEVYPRYTAIPKLQRNGLKGGFCGIAPQRLMKALLSDSRIETMMKAGQKAHLKYFIYNPQRLDECWAAYRITLRNNYHIADIGVWADYINMLVQCGKDIHNAHYVCPADLMAAHDDYQEKIRILREREKLEENRRKALEHEQEFLKMKGRFFGLEFTDGTIVVSVLDSVLAHYQEGDALHHCVGRESYFLNPKCLILSARINGRRIETVELSLTSFKILQSRGLQNKSTEYHDRIIALVRKNVKNVRKRMAA